MTKNGNKAGKIEVIHIFRENPIVSKIRFLFRIISIKKNIDIVIIIIFNFFFIIEYMKYE